MGQVGFGCRLNAPVPGDCDVFNLGAHIPEPVEHGIGIPDHFRIHIIKAKIHGNGDFQSGNGRMCQGNDFLGLQRRDIARMWPAHDILQNNRVGHRSCQWSGMAIEFQIERHVHWRAATWRLVANNMAAGCRNAD